MFGKPAFGPTAPGNSFSFGQNTATTNPFGPNQGLFGKPTAAFGSPSTSTFGQSTSWNNTTNAFGTAPTTQSSFGTTGLFGQQNATGGLFNSTSTFGQQNKPTAFGFGSTQPNTGLFGAQQPQPSNVFNTSGNSGLFGATSFGTPQAGTVVKFNPVTGSDTMIKNGAAQNINTKHQSITCMKEYENKSFEELRFEDYQANRKGPQQPTAGFGTPAFGATTSATPLFGQTDANKSAFGQTTTFGQPFGQNTTGTFGSLTGQQNTTTSPFGAKPTGFGAPTSTSNFGFGTSTAQNVNPFGTSTASKPFGTVPSQPLFGSTTTQANTGFGTGMFASTQNTGTNLFNKPVQPTTGFGTAQTGFSFSSPASTQPSLFPTTTKPLFGSTTSAAPAFGSTLTFGQQQSSTVFGSNFGKPSAPFGTTQPPAFGTNLGGTMTNNQNNILFGNANQTKPSIFGTTGTTGLFNTAAPTPFQSNTLGIGQTQQPQPSLVGQPEQPSNNIALLTNDPFGDAPHLAGLEPKLSNIQAVSATDPKELKSLLDPSKKVDMSHISKLKMTPLKNIRDSLFDTIVPSKDSKSPLTGYNKTSCRRLMLKMPGTTENASNAANSSSLLDVLENENKENVERNKNLEGSVKVQPLRLHFDTSIHSDIANNSIETQTFNLTSTSKENYSELSNDLVTVPEQEEGTGQHGAGDSAKNHPANIICTRPEYYTLPSLDELAPDEKGSCIVKGFTIGRKGYGNVYFLDEMDVAGLNIDELVHFRYREINVYPDDTTKPPVGQGLNRKAQVTLDNVYPRRVGSSVLLKDVSELQQMNFAEKLRKVTEKKNARFVDYRPETGSWVFKVDHFSKYGFTDSDDENEQNGTDLTKKPVQKPKSGEKSLEGQATEAVGGKLKEKENTPKEAVERTIQAASTFGLDKDIFIDENVDEDVHPERDLLHHSMFVDDASEADYHEIPPEIPLDFHFGSYKNSRNIQVMKSTLFADDDRSSDGAASHVSIIKQYLDLPEAEDIVMKLPSLQEEIVISKRSIVRPKVIKVLNNPNVPGSVSSVLPSRCCVDLGMFKGKSFKVGWSRGFSFYSSESEEKDLNGELLLKSFDASPAFDALKDILTESLKVVLKESTYQISDLKVPLFQILKSDTYLKKQTDIFETLSIQYNSAEANYLHSIWTLCTALWGPNDNSTSSRRHLLTEWLKITCNSDDIPLNKGPFKRTEEAARHIFTHLTVFKIFEAAEIAIGNKLPNLALLLAQLSMSNDPKSFIQEQIEIWYGSLASNHISKEMKKLYLLLAGIPTKDDVNIFENVSWKSAFGMHLWYVCPNGAPIDAAIELYEAAFNEYSYAERPSPPYLKQFIERGPYDILYHILLLYKSGVHRLSSVLNPATHTDDPLDYRLSWLLLQLFLSIDVGLVETSEKNKLTTSFSNQLEHLGHWEWAIFVLLFINDDLVKKHAIIGILDRHLSIEVDENFQESIDLLVNDMKIPVEWIHAVKGEKTFATERYFEAFNHFVIADDFVKANKIFVDHLLPSLFINEQFDVLRTLSEKIKSGSRDIQHWNSETGLILDYLDLLEQNITEDNLLKLQVKLSSISDRIVNFPLTTQQHKVCIAELSKKCASLYKELSEKSSVTLLKGSYTQFVENLIMPPDFKQNEGLYLVHNFHNVRICRQ